MSMRQRTRLVGSALRYKGREGMWSWILHRVTGLGILAFLLIHVTETATVIYWPDVYEGFLNSYKTLLFRFAEWIIFFSVLFHSLNGLRIIIQDFWPLAQANTRRLAWASAALTALIMAPVTYILFAPYLGIAEQPGFERARARAARAALGLPAVEQVVGERTSLNAEVTR